MLNTDSRNVFKHFKKFNDDNAHSNVYSQHLLCVCSGFTENLPAH